ncbi:zinc finger protein 37-like isoform X23 [Leguminivora glycinivorella]|uniref:zinc finger protein 37-like isoform X23 n=1 Tax=Leguminivora glycinivorella TaxID=1035111 RepID=UPI00200E333C|nr:zinc finger protein 37-like isoform X23 [Leguminivora glycinivorella]
MEGKSTDWVRGPSGPTVCRCCFAEGCYKDISTEYFWMGKKEVYCEMLTETFDLSIAFAQTSGPNSNSRLICEPCISRLRDASEFKKQVQECEKMFMQYLDPGRSTVEEIQLEITQEPMEKGVKLEPVKLEKNQSDDDFDDRGGFEDMDEDDLDDQPLTKLASKVPKKESVDLLDLLDNAKAEKRKSSTKAKASPAKKAKTKKETPKATVSKPKPEKKKKVDTIDQERRNAEAIIQYTTAYPFRVNDQSILCVYCGDLHGDPANFRHHMINEHAKFNHRMPFENLPKSEYVKVDITNLQCRICNQSFPNIEQAFTHLKDHSKVIYTDSPLGVMPFILDSQWSCAVCCESFPSLLHLNRHTITHFSRYVCEICGKSYVATTGLLQHVRKNHESYKAYCRRCGMFFSSMAAKSLHQRTEKKCMPHCCPNCPERFPTWDQKQQHMVDNHGLVKKEYQCSECNVICSSRRTFYDHFKLCHSSEFIACLHCGLRVPTASSLDRHLKRKHKLLKSFFADSSLPCQ